MSLLHDVGNRWWWCRGQVSLAWCGNWKYDLCRRPSFSPTRRAGLKNRRWWRGHKLLLQANIFLSWCIALSAKNLILSHWSSWVLENLTLFVMLISIQHRGRLSRAGWFGVGAQKVTAFGKLWAVTIIWPLGYMDIPWLNPLYCRLLNICVEPQKLVLLT